MSEVGDHLRTATDQLELADRLAVSRFDYMLYHLAGAVVHTIAALVETNRQIEVTPFERNT